MSANPNQRVDAADYLVVGGGSAGCVLAARLSEDPAVQVVLIEAGRRDDSLWLRLPVTYYKTTGAQFTWGFQTSAQHHQGDIVTSYTQAKVLGGGSSINAQVYMRGTRADYDAWKDDFGCPGWGYDEVLPYFKKAEDNTHLASELHGSGGPLKVSNQAHTHSLTLAWLKACQQAGLPYNADFNDQRAGCGLYQVTNREGRRSSTAHCYLDPARQRKNLTILTETQALRVVFDGHRACGVELAGDDGSVRPLRARCEVILCAGAIGTPQLLLHSGIGDARALAGHGIKALHDNPEVGANLQDHLDVFLIYELTGAYSYDKYKRLSWQLRAGLEFALFRSGPVTSNVVEGGAFWWVDRNDPEPDVQFHFLAGAGVETGIADVPGGNGCTLNAYLTRPRSRGRVSLASSDPREPPLINPNYLSDPDDLAKTVDAVHLGRRLMAGTSLAPYLQQEHFPGINVRSQAELEAFVRSQARTGYHPAGTCRMGRDPRAVVDLELRVRGVDGLRIADNSIMPRLVSANTNATAIMIGERAADFIQHGDR